MLLALIIVILSIAASVIALVWAYRFYAEMLRADEGTELMRSIAASVRTGAGAYLRQQFKWVTIFFIIVAILLAFASYGLGVQSPFVWIAFLTGGLFSGLCGWFGMQTATLASSRTASAARRSLNEGLQIAFRSGAVMGLTVVGLGLSFICFWFAILYWGVPRWGGESEAMSLQQISVTMLSFGMGASVQALFARVGGGIFTKAADVGADLVGKVEQSLQEDSPRNPATIADNVGDNVGDVAGMGADLYESYGGSILAASALGVAAFNTSLALPEGVEHVDAQLRAMMLPIAIAAAGIICSIIGVYAVRTSENLSQKALLDSLAKGINLAALLVVIVSVALAFWLMPQVPGTMLFGVVPGIALSIITGLVAGWMIGKWTEYATSDHYRPTKELAKQAETGPATIIIAGLAEGMLSVWAPVVIVCAATVLSFGLASGGNFGSGSYFALGLYGIGISAVGMLSTLGITLATDAYGPIADNAGGNAEMAGLEPTVRERTDALDSLGNTTAATGKGFAIGSAALTALALLAAYVESVREGFVRWGESAEVQTVDEPGWYKLTDSLLVDRTGARPEVFLIQPTHQASTAAAQHWQQLAPGTAIEAPAAAASSTPVAGDSVGELAVSHASRHRPFSPLNTNLISVREATLQDFLIYYDATLMNPGVLVGIFLGAMSSFLFCAMTMKSVGRAAQQMVVEVRRQFLESPGILDGTVQPDYQTPVAISTKAAQREMIAPGLVGVMMPIVVGLVFGVAGVLGLLIGCLTSGFCLAIFMANSGGAWDNAKKYIEAGNFGGKGSDAHKASVVGDTVGDPFKDTSGPSLNILIKLMSMVSVVVAGAIVRYSLVALGVY